MLFLIFSSSFEIYLKSSFDLLVLLKLKCQSNGLEVEKNFVLNYNSDFDSDSINFNNEVPTVCSVGIRRLLNIFMIPACAMQNLKVPPINPKIFSEKHTINAVKDKKLIHN